MTLDQVLSGAQRWHIEQGDSAIVAKSIPDCSIDAIVADPPAGIGFMGLKFDHDRGGKEHWIEWLAGILREGYRVLKPGGHMLLWALPRTSHWTMEAVDRAGFECRDVITHLNGAGFPKSLDVSKAIDAAKGATREVVGPPPYKRGAAGQQYSDTRAVSWDCQPQPVTAPATPEARRWSGFGTALKPAAEFWILARKPLSGTVAANVLAHGTGALNVDAARVGTGDTYNRAPASSGYSGIAGYEKGSGRMAESSNVGRWPANLVLSHAAWEETHCPCGAVLSFVARFCPECGSGAVTHRRAGCCAVGERSVSTGTTYEPTGDREGRSTPLSPAKMLGRVVGYADPDGLETVTAWECLATCRGNGYDDLGCGLSTLSPSGGAPPRCKCGRGMSWACAVARLDEQSGDRRAAYPGNPDAAKGYAGTPVAPGIFGGNAAGESYADSGGASRFFNTFAPPDDIEPFFWCAKPSAAETEAGCEALPLKSAAENVDREPDSPGTKSPRAGAGRLSGRRNHHATKKSVALMAHFCRLATPPGGIILDMFAGSGSTGCAATLHGFRFIGIEQEPDYTAIARARVTFWARLAGTRAGVGKPRPKREDGGESGQGRLF